MSHRLTLHTPEYETKVHVRLSKDIIRVTIFLREYTADLANQIDQADQKSQTDQTDQADRVSDMLDGIITRCAVIIYNANLDRYELTNGGRYVVLEDVVEKDLLAQIAELHERINGMIGLA